MPPGKARRAPKGGRYTEKGLASGKPGPPAPVSLVSQARALRGELAGVPMAQLPGARVTTTSGWWEPGRGAQGAETPLC